MAVEASISIIPPLIMGVVIGLIELFFVHADENFRGSHWLGHGLHALIFAIIFTFIVFNIDYVLSLIKLNLQYAGILVRLIVGIIAYIKIAGSAAGAGKAVREKVWHTAVIVLLIIFSNYIWMILEPACNALLTSSFCQ
ncbi:MAG TPA: hypothetical protein VJJ23_02535 [Candidatus Nanoarchaeia archaeon]|nr:hypothetical protein [Candidatus Nanoarchaeia archaeon]